MEYFIGLLLVILAGIGTGAGAWPFKVAKDMRLEIYLLVWVLLSLVVAPWAVTFFTVSDVAGVARSVGWKPLLIANALSCSWGIANVLYMICVLKIGAALTGAILGAVAMAVGMILPLVVKGSGQFSAAPSVFSPAGILIIDSLAVIIFGIVLVTAAGIGREKALAGESVEERRKRASGNFLEGLFLVTLAGILSTGLSLSFVYTQDAVIAAIHQQGAAGLLVESFAPWAFAVVGGALVQIVYASVQLTRKNMWRLFFDRKTEIVLGVLAGLQFFASLLCLGRGMLMLGALGAAVGFGIQQSIQTVANQLVGFWGGEWKGVFGPPRRTMYMAIIVLLFAVALLSESKLFTDNAPPVKTPSAAVEAEGE